MPAPRVAEVGYDASTPLPELAMQAIAHDQLAWRALVDRLKGVAWKVLYGYDLSEEDRKDAFASTFFRLYEHLGGIRELEKLPGWVATTARNEAHTIFRRRRNTVPMDTLGLRETPTVEEPDQVVAGELHTALHAAFARLTPQSQALMRLLTTDPPLSYDEISSLLDIPRGSIGPLRQRCLERLRTSPELAPFTSGGSRF